MQISIHALREEGDVSDMLVQTQNKGISIHALREEGDGADVYDAVLNMEFLSTPSARRATSSTPKSC